MLRTERPPENFETFSVGREGRVDGFLLKKDSLPRWLQFCEATSVIYDFGWRATETVSADTWLASFWACL